MLYVSIFSSCTTKSSYPLNRQPFSRASDGRPSWAITFSSWIFSVAVFNRWGPRLRPSPDSSPPWLFCLRIHPAWPTLGFALELLQPLDFRFQFLYPHLMFQNNPQQRLH